MNLQFTKVEGLGNDFLLVDARDQPLAQAEAMLRRLREDAPALCDRRRGVGGDGILLVGPGRSAGAAATMWVVNHDGSQPEMCGNGLRCVAYFVARDGGRQSVNIDTDAGLKACRVEDGSQEARVEVDMGPGRDLGVREPAAGSGRSFHGISMGNPHAIAFVEPDEDPEALARALGPDLEVDPAYPDRTNVEFARVHPNDHPRIELWVWERGCGITHACGTGACATVVAAVLQGRVEADTPVEVDLPGGRLSILVPADPTRGVRMTGPARIVFTGMV